MPAEDINQQLYKKLKANLEKPSNESKSKLYTLIYEVFPSVRETILMSTPSPNEIYDAELSTRLKAERLLLPYLEAVNEVICNGSGEITRRISRSEGEEIIVLRWKRGLGEPGYGDPGVPQSLTIQLDEEYDSRQFRVYGGNRSYGTKFKLSPDDFEYNFYKDDWSEQLEKALENIVSNPTAIFFDKALQAYKEAQRQANWKQPSGERTTSEPQEYEDEKSNLPTKSSENFEDRLDLMTKAEREEREEEKLRAIARANREAATRHEQDRRGLDANEHMTLLVALARNKLMGYLEVLRTKLPDTREIEINSNWENSRVDLEIIWDRQSSEKDSYSGIEMAMILSINLNHDIFISGGNPRSQWSKQTNLRQSDWEKVLEDAILYAVSKPDVCKRKWKLSPPEEDHTP